MPEEITAPGAPANTGVPGAQTPAPGAPAVNDPAAPGAPLGNPTNTLPTDVTTLQNMVLSLRRSEGDYRVANKSLTEKLTAETNRANAAETRWASADTNTSELLKSKNDEIARLTAEVDTLKTKVGTFEQMQSSEKELLLAQIPESTRERYKDFSVENLRTVISTFPAPRQSDGVALPAGHVVSNLQKQMDEAVAREDWDTVDKLEEEMRKRGEIK